MICHHCDREIGYAAVCPYCQTRMLKEPQPHYLPSGTVIDGRYRIEGVLGEGGFGITYLAIDKKLGHHIAVKEFFPHGFSYRNTTVSNELYVSASDTKEYFEHGRKRFLDEARTLARFNEEPGVVSVTDYTEENNTVYLVMEFLSGETLQQYLKQHGVLRADEAFRMLEPVMRTLEKIHAAGIIHRDISPDNIMRLSSGQLKLMDFGAAREFVDDNHSMSVMLKKGYAPEEQYRRSGEQGPWTDVYALCATIYRCITGRTPDDALDRLAEDHLKKPSAFGADISPALEEVLMYGLAVRKKHRCQSMMELLRSAENAAKTEAPSVTDHELLTDEVSATDLAETETLSTQKTDVGELVTLKTAIPHEAEMQPADEDATVIAEQETTEDGATEPVEVDTIDDNATKLADEPLTVEDQPVKADTEKDKKVNNRKAADTGVQPLRKKPVKGISIGLAAAVLIVTAVVVAITVGKSRDTVVSSPLIASSSADIASSAAAETAAPTEEPTAEPVKAEKWSDLMEVVTTQNATIGLRKDGTVVSTGKLNYGQEGFDDWTDIIAIDAGTTLTVGLKEDGTVVSTAYMINRYVSDWTDITAVSTGADHVVGLKKDGTVVATGSGLASSDKGQSKVDDWTDIVAISAGDYHTVGLKKDGTVVAVGENDDGECDVDDWTDIVAIHAGYRNTFGIKSDGTVVETYRFRKADGWTDITAITGNTTIYGLKKDGTVVVHGSSSYGMDQVEDWKDIVAFSANIDHAVAIKKDGTAVAVGSNGNGQCDVYD